MALATPGDIGVAAGSGESERGVDLEELRRAFPITRSAVFLNHATSSALPEPVARALEDAARVLAERGPDRDWIAPLVRRARVRLAGLIDAPVANVAFTSSTTHGLGLLAAGLDWREGDNVVTANGEYPANVYPWMSLRRRGVETRLAQPKNGVLSADELMRLVDDRTRVVSLSFVEFGNGFRNDIETIGAECRRRGVIFCVDAVQGLGALRLSVRSTAVDFLSAGAHKWLLGPPGVGFVYVHEDLVDRLVPPIVGTESVVQSSEYFDYDFTLPREARRLEAGTLNLIGIAGFDASLALIATLDAGWIEARVVGLARRLRRALEGQGCELVGPQPEQRSGIVAFRPVAASAAAVQPRLWEAGFQIALRSDFLRASPHFYNTEAELDALVEQLGRAGRGS